MTGIRARFDLRPWRDQLLDGIPLLMLLAIAVWIAGFIVRDDLFLFGDHPGHYWVMWYTLKVAWPLHHRLIDWIPYWYAGYPELQFTPPGYVILGWLLDQITFGRLSTLLVYETVVFAAYILPAFTFYYAVRHWAFGRVAAFSAGLFTLILPSFFDGANAIFVGMIGSRLAWGLGALVMAWGIDYLEGRGLQYAWLATVALAASLLMHPYHQPGILLALLIYALVRRLPLLRSIGRLGVLVVPALMLDGFWLLPLFAHSSTAMIPLVRATLDQTWRLLTDPALAPFALLALPAVARARSEQDAGKRAILLVLTALPVALGVTMLGVHITLIERLQFYRLDPVRLIGEFYLGLVLLAAIGAVQVAHWLARLANSRRIPGAAAATGFLLVLWVYLSVPFQQSAVALQPGRDQEPRFLSQAIKDYSLDELWETLRQAPGRVLFTSFSTRLNARGGEAFPTTLAALTPLYTKRPIIGGTYSHWSPIAALVWVGNPTPPVLEGLAEDQDDRGLFGVAWEELDHAVFAAYCRRLNVSTIVASSYDYQTRLFLDASPHLQSYFNNGYFFVYRLKDHAGEWFEARNATVEMAEHGDDSTALRVRSAQADAQVQIKQYAYPLWSAYTEKGEQLPVTADDLGLIEIALPAGEDYVVTVRYEQGAVEQLGNWLSIVSTLVLAGAGIAIAHKRPGDGVRSKGTAGDERDA